jgi:patatin-related protein
MREKELRLALICYGGISLAVYMHGITKEIWHLARASQRYHAGEPALSGSAAVYFDLLRNIEDACQLKLRVLPDIIAGASAGGINGIFLSQAIATGQSLEPLTKLWLNYADIEQLLDPDARRMSFIGNAWSVPLARSLVNAQDEALEASVAPEARAEVRQKLAQFVRSRWFAPPFGGETFCTMLLDAFDAMEETPMGPRLLPAGQPLDLFVTVTDFFGYKQQLKLNSPQMIAETEHRLIIGFRDTGDGLGDAPSLTYAARATASFPGAFPPFTVHELDQVTAKRGAVWPERKAFLKRTLPRDCPDVEAVVLIDGSVLANAPFAPAIAALKNRPARREVDRRFVYIDPTPGGAQIGISVGERSLKPGFFTTIIAAVSGIPREQPIHDSLEALNARSMQILRMRRIIAALEPEVERNIEKLGGQSLFLDYPTADRLARWRSKAHTRATREAGYAYAAYGHIKLSGVIEDAAALIASLQGAEGVEALDHIRAALWSHVQAARIDQITTAKGAVSPESLDFFRTHDLRFRIRRLRFVARKLTEFVEAGLAAPDAVVPLRTALFGVLAAYLDAQGHDMYAGIQGDDPISALAAIGARRDLIRRDAESDVALVAALSACPSDIRRRVLLAYLGFAYYDIATLPLLQGEGLDEFDPIRVDRIAPDDATAIRSGGSKAVLKGIEFHNFGAFFSRAYRENDYLWGRLHGADRLIDILVSTLPSDMSLPETIVAAAKRAAFLAIIDEERGRLTHIPELIASLDRELAQK